MKPIKRLEIIIDSGEIKHIVKLIEKAGISGYTLIKQVEGQGSRGYRDADSLTNNFANHCLLIACSEQELLDIQKDLKPILTRGGGLCIVSDAFML